MRSGRHVCCLEWATYLPTEMHVHREAPLQVGHMQVNKALQTCTLWYAYAAMFGCSISYTHIQPNGVSCMYTLSTAGRGGGG